MPPKKKTIKIQKPSVRSTGRPKKKKTAKRRTIRQSKKKRPVPAWIGILLLLFLSFALFKAIKNAPQTRPEPKKDSKKIEYQTVEVKPKVKQPIKKKTSTPNQKEPKKVSKAAPKKQTQVQSRQSFEDQPAPETPLWLKRPAKAIDWRGPVIVFVLDDMGNNNQYDRLLMQLEDDVTYAVLPLLKYSPHYGKLSKKTGAEVILHQPMEALSESTIPGPGLIVSEMSEKQIITAIDRNLKSVPNHVGANNHMGSLGTSNPYLMETLLSELKRRGLFFLDSYTSPKSKAVSVGNMLKIPNVRRDVFLDNIDKPEAIRAQVVKTAQIAKETGLAIAIGHYRKNTLQVLVEEIPQLKNAGYQMASLSDVMKKKYA